jgi:hypothetical protein
MRILAIFVSEGSSRRYGRCRCCHLPLCPYFEGSELAPATAKRGEAKKVRRAASISVSRFWARVCGMCGSDLQVGTREV